MKQAEEQPPEQKKLYSMNDETFIKAGNPRGGCWSLQEEEWKKLGISPEYPAKWADNTTFDGHICMKKYVQEEDEECKNELDKTMLTYIRNGVISAWDWSDSAPNIIAQVRAIRQSEKFRIITDLRPTNLLIEESEVVLPSVEQVARKTANKPTKLMKCDLRWGYHQMKLPEKVKRFICIVWKGIVWKWDATPFGLKDAPREFQKRTAAVAEEVNYELGSTGSSSSILG